MPETGFVTDRFGVQRIATLMTCEDCGAAEFLIYQIMGQSHHHLQCVACGTSYCLGGECHLPDDPNAPEKTN
jgi:hypothetical protein